MKDIPVFVDGKETILSEFYKSDIQPTSSSGGGPGTLPVGWSPDPTKYHDINAVVIQDGVPLASRFPAQGRSSRGGTIIPRHIPGPGGGSMGFSPDTQIKVIVDEGLTNRPIEFQSGNFTPDQVAKAMSKARNSGLVAPDDIGAAAYAILATEQAARRTITARPQTAAPERLAARSVSFADVIAGQQTVVELPQQGDPLSPAPEVSFQEVKQASAQPQPTQKPGKQSLVTSVQSSSQTEASILNEVMKPKAAQGEKAVPQGSDNQFTPPVIKVLFEFPEPVGYFEAHYHDVICTDRCVILVYDRKGGGTPWFPAIPRQPKEGEEDPSANLVIGMTVFDREGNRDTSFAVLPPVERFPYRQPAGAIDFCLLPVVQSKSHKEINNAIQE